VSYPKELKQNVLSRMMAPRNEAVSVLAREFNVTAATLYALRRVALEARVATPSNGRNAEEWRGSAKFAVMLETAALLILRKKSGGDPGRGKGRMIGTQDRCAAVTLIDEALESGARLFRACAELDLCPRTYRRWTVQKGAVKAEGRPGEDRPVPANAAKPERWRGSTRNWERPATVWLNPVRQENQTVKLAA